MKFLLLLSLLATPAFAKKIDGPISLYCSTDIGTTFFDFATSGENEMLLKVRHINGVQYMPIHEGVVVPADIPYLKNKANMLTKMGEAVDFKFPRSSCHIDGPGLIACGDGETKKFDGITMQALNFYTAKVHESTMGLELDSWKVTLSIWSPDFIPVMDVTMIYGENNCKFSGF